MFPATLRPWPGWVDDSPGDVRDPHSQGRAPYGTISRWGRQIMWKSLKVPYQWLSIWLVVWNMNFIFPYIGNVIIPTDFHIFQRGWNHQPVNEGLRGKIHETLGRKKTSSPLWSRSSRMPLPHCRRSSSSLPKPSGQCSWSHQGDGWCWLKNLWKRKSTCGEFTHVQPPKLKPLKPSQTEMLKVFSWKLFIVYSSCRSVVTVGPCVAFFWQISELDRGYHCKSAGARVRFTSQLPWMSHQSSNILEDEGKTCCTRNPIKPLGFERIQKQCLSAHFSGTLERAQESTLFGVLVVQIKPQLEKLLNLPDDSLTKEPGEPGTWRSVGAAHDLLISGDQVDARSHGALLASWFWMGWNDK